MKFLRKTVDILAQKWLQAMISLYIPSVGCQLHSVKGTSLILWTIHERVHMAETDHQSYYDALSEEAKMILVLRDELYEESWTKMVDDLKNRLKGRPYIFKLVNRIEEDLERIETVRSYEEKHNINLRDFDKGESS